MIANNLLSLTLKIPTTTLLYIVMGQTPKGVLSLGYFSSLSLISTKLPIPKRALLMQDAIQPIR